MIAFLRCNGLEMPSNAAIDQSSPAMFHHPTSFRAPVTSMSASSNVAFNLSRLDDLEAELNLLPVSQIQAEPTVVNNAINDEETN